MHRLGVLLKSYAQDFHYAERMVDSFHRHNVDDLPLFIVVPDDDKALFEPLVQRNTELILESDFAEHLVDEAMWGLRPGYVNQEIIKLAFWEKGLAENYFCADSELVFLRDFDFDDFMFDATTPYTVLVEDNELKVEPRYFREHWQGREMHLRHIQTLVGLNDRRLLTCHGHQIMSSEVLRSLRADFMEPRGWSYQDLLREAPYEFSWYNFWLQKHHPTPIRAREPLVKTFHHEGQELEYAMRGISGDDVARGFIGVVANSNYGHASQQPGIPPTLTGTAETLASLVRPRVLVQALAIQARGSLLPSRRATSQR